MIKVSTAHSRQPSTIEGVIVFSGDAEPTPTELVHLSELLDVATRAAAQSALTHGIDMPVGAATSKDGHILSADYAQDNSLDDKEAHAELMAIQRTRNQFPGVDPDIIAVTLEPCNACQDYLAKLPGLRIVAYVLPLTAAASRHIIRPKDETIFERDRRDKLPYQVIQVNDERLRTVGELLLDATTRDIDTGKTVVDVAKIRERLPVGYLPQEDTAL